MDKKGQRERKRTLLTFSVRQQTTHKPGQNPLRVESRKKNVKRDNRRGDFERQSREKGKAEQKRNSRPMAFFFFIFFSLLHFFLYFIIRDDRCQIVELVCIPPKGK
jgi:hypothetical protein